MTTLFITIGTSAVENHAIWTDNQDLLNEAGCQEGLPEDIRRFLRGIDDADDIPATLADKLIKFHRAFWSQKPAYWVRRENRYLASAETISTYFAIEHSLIDVAQINTVVLLRSNTATGRLCSSINKALLSELPFFERLQKSGAILEKDIKILNPTAMRTTRKEGHPIFPQISKIVVDFMTDAADSCIFNITGSYKGIIPPITYLCATDYRDRSSLLYMHADMEATVELTFSHRELEENVIHSRQQAEQLRCIRSKPQVS